MTHDGGAKLNQSLAEIGRDTAARKALIDALVAWEKREQRDGVDLRETMTGPIVDALHAHVPEVTRRLASGIVFTMPYKSKIAREFAMGVEPLTHVWEPQTTRLLVALAERAQAIVVGGAYSGDHAIPMARTVSSRKGRVHCFELQPAQLRALKANAAQNDLDSVVVNAVGLWDREGFVELSGDDSHASPQGVPERGRDSFPVTTIDRYAQSAGIDRIDVIMLDIEGGEEFALRGATRFLDRPAGEAPHVVFEIHRSYVDWSDGIERTPLVQLLTSRGYGVYALRDFQANVDMAGAPLEMVHLSSVYLEGPPHGFNLFATKRPEVLRELGVKLREGLSPKLLRHRLSPLHQPGQQ